jgi:PIN domain nuclease of toxin-antitoxin system
MILLDTHVWWWSLTEPENISPEIAIDACSLPGKFHKDPADRLIVATARVNNLRLLTKDQKMLEYSHVDAIW